MAIKIESINGKTDIVVSWAEKVKALGIYGLKFEGNIVGIRDEKDETLTLKVANQGDGNLTILNGLSSSWEDIIRHQAEGDAVILRFDIPEVASINTSILQRGIATMPATNKLLEAVKTIGDQQIARINTIESGEDLFNYLKEIGSIGPDEEYDPASGFDDPDTEEEETWEDIKDKLLSEAETAFNLLPEPFEDVDEYIAKLKESYTDSSNILAILGNIIGISVVETEIDIDLGVVRIGVGLRYSPDLPMVTPTYIAAGLGIYLGSIIENDELNNPESSALSKISSLASAPATIFVLPLQDIVKMSGSNLTENGRFPTDEQFVEMEELLQEIIDNPESSEEDVNDAKAVKSQIALMRFIGAIFRDDAFFDLLFGIRITTDSTQNNDELDSDNELEIEDNNESEIEDNNEEKHYSITLNINGTSKTLDLSAIKFNSDTNSAIANLSTYIDFIRNLGILDIIKDIIPLQQIAEMLEKNLTITISSALSYQAASRLYTKGWNFAYLDLNPISLFSVGSMALDFTSLYVPCTTMGPFGMEFFRMNNRTIDGIEDTFSPPMYIAHKWIGLKPDSNRPGYPMIGVLSDDAGYIQRAIQLRWADGMLNSDASEEEIEAGLITTYQDLVHAAANGLKVISTPLGTVFGDIYPAYEEESNIYGLMIVTHGILSNNYTYIIPDTFEETANYYGNGTHFEYTDNALPVMKYNFIDNVVFDLSRLYEALVNNYSVNDMYTHNLISQADMNTNNVSIERSTADMTDVIKITGIQRLSSGRDNDIRDFLYKQFTDQIYGKYRIELTEYESNGENDQVPDADWSVSNIVEDVGRALFEIYQKFNRINIEVICKYTSDDVQIIKKLSCTGTDIDSDGRIFLGFALGDIFVKIKPCAPSNSNYQQYEHPLEITMSIPSKMNS